MAGHPVDRHVGAQLRSFRLQRGLSQSAVAAAVGLTFQQLQKYEKGSNRVSASKLFELAAILGVQVQEFFAGLPEERGKAPEQGVFQPASRVDAEILQLVAQLGDGPVKRGIKGVLQAIVDAPDEASRGV